MRVEKDRDREGRDREKDGREREGRETKGQPVDKLDGVNRFEMVAKRIW